MRPGREVGHRGCVHISPGATQKGRRSQVQKPSEKATNPLGWQTKSMTVLRWYREHSLPTRKSKERLMQN